MAVYGITSVAGSPGVTTTAVTWTIHSARETLMVEADPAGGSPVLAGILRSEIPHEQSLLGVLVRHENQRTVLEQLSSQRVQLATNTSRSFIPGIPEHHQARALAGEWSEISQALHAWSSEADIDIVIDLGRVTTEHYPTPLMATCDYVLAMCRADLPSLHRAHAAVGALKHSLGELEHSRIGVVTVESPQESYGSREVRKLMTPTPVLAQLPHNPAAAATYSLGTAPRRRAVRPWIKAVQELAGTTRSAATEFADMLEGR